MSKLSDWKVAERIRASGRRGVIIGLSIAALVCLIVAVIIIKARWLRRHFGCCGADYSVSEGEEEGCCYTSDKDFV